MTQIGDWSIEIPPQIHDIFVSPENNKAIIECEGEKIASISTVSNGKISIHAKSCRVTIDYNLKKIWISGIED